MIKKGLQIDKLNQLLKKWIKNFRLESWDINIKITNFERKDFKQSGDIKINLKNKKATLLLTNKPFRDEEGTIVHELVHLLLWDYDTFSEKAILKNCLNVRQFFCCGHDYFSKINSPLASALSWAEQVGQGRSSTSSESKRKIKQSPGGTLP